MFQRSQAVVCIRVTYNSKSSQTESNMSIYLKSDFFIPTWPTPSPLLHLCSNLTLSLRPTWQVYLLLCLLPSSLYNPLYYSFFFNPLHSDYHLCSIFFSFPPYHCKTRLSRKVWLLLNVETFSIITMVLELFIGWLFSCGTSIFLINSASNSNFISFKLSHVLTSLLISYPVQWLQHIWGTKCSCRRHSEKF